MSDQRLEFRGAYLPLGEQRALHDRVRADAGDRCVRCGHPKGDKLETRAPCDERCTHESDGKMRVLTVHHMDGDKSNNRWWNLLALCQVCHLVIQAKVIPERPWLFEHTRWFVPYACGFYASYYGGQEITREEADANPERWLALNPALA